jgi:hypothetical protein
MLYRGDHDRVLPRRVIGLIGNGFFNALFLKHAAGVPRTIENVILGPIVAVLSFVCSVGNVPLAAVLWSGGSPSSSGMGGHRHHRGWAVPVSSGMGGPRIIGDGRSPYHRGWAVPVADAWEAASANPRPSVAPHLAPAGDQNDLSPRMSS